MNTALGYPLKTQSEFMKLYWISVFSIKLQNLNTYQKKLDYMYLLIRGNWFIAKTKIYLSGVRPIKVCKKKHSFGSETTPSPCFQNMEVLFTLHKVHCRDVMTGHAE